MPDLELNRDQRSSSKVPLVIGLGIVFGLVFGVPPALDAHAFGLGWMPYGLAVIATGLFVGLVVASFLSVVFTDSPFLPARKQPVPCPTVPPKKPAVERTPDPIRRRLAQEKACVERLRAEHRREAAIDRIVWSELLELELQDVDEQLQRICGAANAATNEPPRQGDPHGCNSE